jgi:hypothetical protein
VRALGSKLSSALVLLFFPQSKFYVIYFGFYRICGETLSFGAFICFDANYLKQCNQVRLSCFQSSAPANGRVWFQANEPHACGVVNSPSVAAQAWCHRERSALFVILTATRPTPKPMAIVRHVPMIAYERNGQSRVVRVWFA